jgi:hypothetical protein
MASEELYDDFQNTEEMLAWDDFCSAARKALDEGQATAELPTAFLALVLPELRTDPLQFAAMRAVWNRLCDEKGVPEEKIEPASKPDEEVRF